MLTMLAGFAEFERAPISERTATALTFKRQARGLRADAPWLPAHGATLKPHKGELATVARIRAWAEAGEGFAAIARRLNADEVPTKRGGRWHASTVRYLVRNELYEPAEAV